MPGKAVYLGCMGQDEQVRLAFRGFTVFQQGDQIGKPEDEVFLSGAAEHDLISQVSRIGAETGLFPLIVAVGGKREVDGFCFRFDLVGTLC